jgi:hypothetical protein
VQRTELAGDILMKLKVLLQLGVLLQQLGVLLL